MEHLKQKKRYAVVRKDECVACGCCVKVCPKKAIAVMGGVMAAVNLAACVGCGLCAKECPASAVFIQEASK